MADTTIAEMNTKRFEGQSSNPRSPEEAKENLRAAAQRLSLARAVQREPWKGVGIALGAGFMLGYCWPLRKSLVGLSVLALRASAAVMSELGRSPFAETKPRRPERQPLAALSHKNGPHGRKS
jgi:hypothetical protein